jgi:hypothetical protein
MEGGYGGFIWLYGSSTVHYFFGSFSKFEVSNTDINELEFVAGSIAADLANQVVPHVEGGNVMHYLYAFGDSAVCFDHVMPGATASAHGLRFLYRKRAMADQLLPRITVTQAIRRGLNQPSDDLSNGLEEKFKLEILKLLGPNLDFVRLAVTAEQASVLDLIEWKSMCVQGTDA